MEKTIKRIVWAVAVAAVLLPAAKAARAEGFVIDTYRNGMGGYSATYRPLGPSRGHAGIYEVVPVPTEPNGCEKAGVRAFEVLNPGPGEARCVGAVRHGN